MKEAILGVVRSPVMGSAARWVVAFLLGLFGVKYTTEQAGEIAAAAIALIGLIVSVWFSHRADVKQVSGSAKPDADPKEGRTGA